MDIMTIYNQFLALKREANTLRGNMHLFPLSVVEGPSFTGHVWCKVASVSLEENSVSLLYSDPEDGEIMSTHVSISTFVRLVEKNHPTNIIPLHK